MTDLVADDEPLLLGVEQVEQAGGHDDERLLLADRHGVGLGIHLDVELGNLVQVEDVGGVPEVVVQLRELGGAHPDGAGEVQQADRALVDPSEEGFDEGVETSQRPQRDQGAAVGRVLVGTGGDIGKPDADAVW